MALKPNFSAQLSNIEALKRIAARLGYTQTRGREKGQGSIRQLLEAIAAGEATVVTKAATKPARSEQEKQEQITRALEQRGMLARRARRRGALSPFKPVKVEGEPVSEMIIRERR